MKTTLNLIIYFKFGFTFPLHIYKATLDIVRLIISNVKTWSYVVMSKTWS